MKLNIAIPPVSASNVERYRRCQAETQHARVESEADEVLRQRIAGVQGTHSVEVRCFVLLH